jgi:hypothetical protein
MSRSGWAAGALVFVCVLTAGCTSSSDADAPDKAADEADEAGAILQDAKKMGSPQQAEALADGHISVEEMEASIEAFEACLASTHWHLEEVYPDPIAGEPHFTFLMVPDRPDRDDAERNDCDVRTFRFVDVFAQSIQESAPMDPPVRARTHTCLEDARIRTSPDDRTAKEIFMTAEKKNVDDVADCMLDAHGAEFPDREEITVGIPPEVGEG